ncbi:predicted protein [Coccidioides posadasii str. Silveira]|uniref:Predicted protein n=2 Tax=Coccidioides posadasii TaxID=199306 RepID=E9CY85_COCPS|nr:predicted protein [Coccidioides posadasii str. Silveira]KMM72533.1 hypothetical protein CPAG_08827 [Coccidioides posadasii RMSCC 3488]
MQTLGRFRNRDNAAPAPSPGTHPGLGQARRPNQTNLWAMEHGGQRNAPELVTTFQMRARHTVGQLRRNQRQVLLDDTLNTDDVVLDFRTLDLDQPSHPCIPFEAAILLFVLGSRVPGSGLRAGIEQGYEFSRGVPGSFNTTPAQRPHVNYPGPALNTQLSHRFAGSGAQSVIHLPPVGCHYAAVPPVHHHVDTTSHLGRSPVSENLTNSPRGAPIISKDLT